MIKVPFWNVITINKFSEKYFLLIPEKDYINHSFKEKKTITTSIKINHTNYKNFQYSEAI